MMDTHVAATTDAVTQARIELAAACRWASRLGFQSGVCNHFSVSVPGRPDLMLINPEGYFWAEVTASSLVLADHQGNILSDNGNTVELTAFCIHAPIHAALPQATAVLHTHMHHATAICMREGGEIAKSYLSAMSFYDRIAYDRAFDGAALTPAEGARLAGVIGEATVLMMQNHGPIVVGASIGEALLRLVYLEDTCKMQLLAEAGDAKLAPIPETLIKASEPHRFANYGRTFITAVVRTLTREEPEFRS
jgi:ribulose-5-phosphate 4-epimerase/fuculose-1-phosphate aldolase